MKFPCKIGAVTFNAESQWLNTKDDCELFGRSSPATLQQKFFAPLAIMLTSTGNDDITAEDLCFPQGLNWYKEHLKKSISDHVPQPYEMSPKMKTYCDWASATYEAYTTYDSAAPRYKRDDWDQIPWRTRKEFESRTHLMFLFCHNYISYFCHQYKDQTSALAGCKAFFSDHFDDTHQKTEDQFGTADLINVMEVFKKVKISFDAQMRMNLEVVEKEKQWLEAVNTLRHHEESLKHAVCDEEKTRMELTEIRRLADLGALKYVDKNLKEAMENADGKPKPESPDVGHGPMKYLNEARENEDGKPKPVSPDDPLVTDEGSQVKKRRVPDITTPAQKTKKAQRKLHFNHVVQVQAMDNTPALEIQFPSGLFKGQVMRNTLQGTTLTPITKVKLPFPFLLAEEDKQVVLRMWSPRNELVAAASEDSDASHDVFYHKRLPFSCSFKSFLTLRPNEWLDDQAITAYLSVLVNTKSKDWFFKPDFIPKALLPWGSPVDTEVDVNEQDFQYNNVREFGTPEIWGRSKSIFDLDQLFIPINVGGSHWTCAYIHFQTSSIYLYDPLWNHKDGKIYQAILLNYIGREHLARKGLKLPTNATDEWRMMPCELTKGPKQKDGHNCGVYICLMAELLINRHVRPDILLLQDWEFTVDEMVNYRHRMAATILKGVVPPSSPGVLMI
jgi:Ulp1 protease family, C-terminal catalytic domain